MFEIACAFALTAAAILATFRAWTRRAKAWMGGATLLALASAIIWCRAYGAEIGIPLAIETTSLASLAFIVSRTERRPDRQMRNRQMASNATTPPQRLHGAARTLVAGPLGLVSAMGMAIAIAVRAPMVEQTRLILAGLIVPSLWALFLVWSVATRRLARTAGVLAVLACAGFTVAIIPKG